jgi:hypothetical protein
VRVELKTEGFMDGNNKDELVRDSEDTTMWQRV